MHKDLIRLQEIASASSRSIIGLMSGTSLDGLDVALCRFSGQGTATEVQLLQFNTISYPNALKSALKEVAFKRMADLEQVALLNAHLGNYYAELILDCLRDWEVKAEEVDLIASHGQTIYHAPAAQHKNPLYSSATLQIGDGDHIAVKTGIITLSDFRQKHVAAGGEGAPLSVYGDYLLFSSPTENRVLLNIGGISNFTHLPAGDKSLMITTDAGPGNTLMDRYVQVHFPGKHYDKNGEIAARGQVNEELLQMLLDDPFFRLSFPKTTGPEVFSLDYLGRAMESSKTKNLSPADVLATLSMFTVQAILMAIQACIPAGQQYEIYISGGGMHNLLLIQNLSKELNKNIRNTAELDVDPDAKEAVLFALLANECIAGQPLGLNAGQAMPDITMGKISLTS